MRCKECGADVNRHQLSCKTGEVIAELLMPEKGIPGFQNVNRKTNPSGYYLHINPDRVDRKKKP